MKTITRQYEISSHNDFCACGLALAKIFHELIILENLPFIIEQTGFIKQKLILDNKDVINIELAGYYRSKETYGDVINSDTYNTLCLANVEVIKDGNYKTPYTLKISLKYEDDITNIILDSTNKLRITNPVTEKNWKFVEPGMELSCYSEPDGPSLNITVIAIGRNKFIGIPNNTEEELLYSKSDKWILRKLNYEQI